MLQLEPRYIGAKNTLSWNLPILEQPSHTFLKKNARRMSNCQRIRTVTNAKLFRTSQSARGRLAGDGRIQTTLMNVS